MVHSYEIKIIREFEDGKGAIKRKERKEKRECKHK